MGKEPSSSGNSLGDFGDLGEPPSPEEDITALLVAWGGGDPAAGEELMHRVAGRLRKLAGRFLRQERGDHTLETAELINEAYLRLIQQESVTWQSRRHFFPSPVA